jgi:histone arginine demethylase JMJD6
MADATMYEARPTSAEAKSPPGAGAAEKPIVSKKERRWEKAMKKAKRGHRSDLELNEWGEDHFHEQNICPKLEKEYEDKAEEFQDVLSMSVKTTSRAEFIEQVEKTNIPALVHDIPVEEDWPAAGTWSIEGLRQIYRDTRFRCGDDDDGYPLRVKLDYFTKYMKYNTDDSPLKIFDGTFDENPEAKKLLKDYKVPSYFNDDLFKHVGESRRPPYRWILIAPERSGTSVHIDPLSTSAWNTLLEGRKRWVIFPPHVGKEFVKGKQYFPEDSDNEPIHWFTLALPRLREACKKMEEEQKAAVANASSGEGKEEPYSGPLIYEFTQHPGDTVFVPLDWWHAVLNTTDTLAVTQNFCSRVNFPHVWRDTRKKRKKLARRWLEKLRVAHPDIAESACKMNTEDGFEMKYRTRDSMIQVDNVKYTRIQKGEALASSESSSSSSGNSGSSSSSSSSSSGSSSSSETSSSGSESDSEAEGGQKNSKARKQSVGSSRSSAPPLAPEEEVPLSEEEREEARRVRKTLLAARAHQAQQANERRKAVQQRLNKKQEEDVAGRAAGSPKKETVDPMGLLGGDREE